MTSATYRKTPPRKSGTPGRSAASSAADAPAAVRSSTRASHAKPAKGASRSRGHNGAVGGTPWKAPANRRKGVRMR